MRLSAFILLGLLLFFSSTLAQDIVKINDLSFGAVYPGIPKVVSKTTPGGAAEFHVTGTAGAEVRITFLILPTYINQGGFSMQVMISDNDCAMDSSATPNQSNPGYDDLNPWQPNVYRLGFTGLTIWLGGTAIPNLGQKPGSYSGSIQVRVDYTGN